MQRQIKLRKLLKAKLHQLHYRFQLQDLKARRNRSIDGFLQAFSLIFQDLEQLQD